MADSFQVKLGVALDQAQFAAVQSKLKNLSITVNVKDVSQATKQFTGLNNAVGKTSQSFTDIIGKVFKFGAATAVIGVFTSAVTESVQAVFELDDAVTQFKKVSDLSGESLENYIDKAYDLGKTVARTGSEMIEAATEFRKNGFNDNDSLQLAEIAAKFTNIADEEISSADAASFIISQMKAFNITAADSEKIIDATNEVANNFAVGTGDLEKGLVAAGSALGTYGNSFEQTIGLVTSG